MLVRQPLSRVQPLSVAAIPGCALRPPPALVVYGLWYAAVAWGRLVHLVGRLIKSSFSHPISPSRTSRSCAQPTLDCPGAVCCCVAKQCARQGSVQASGRVKASVKRRIDRPHRTRNQPAHPSRTGCTSPWVRMRRPSGASGVGSPPQVFRSQSARLPGVTRV